MDKDKCVFFWGACKNATPQNGYANLHKGCLSQWQKCSFVVDGVIYSSAEQYMMAEKARTFGDDETLEKILSAKLPMKIKALGREVRGFDGKKWDSVKFEVVVRGNMEKFSQNRELLSFLLGTGDAMLVEASPKDCIWGVGLKESDRDILDPDKWKGENLLGKALMEVRSKLSNTKVAKEIKDNPDACFMEGQRSAVDIVALRMHYIRQENQRGTGRKTVRAAKTVGRAKKLVPGEEEAIARLVANDAHSSDLFVQTRVTLLQRVNAGDHAAFEEFYNIYAPAMLKYLGLVESSKTERDQLDIVQTVFARFYKTFALTEDPDTGKKRVPKSILAALCGTNKKTGKSYSIKFRQYLITCLKNAVRTKWRYETRKGTVDLVSIDSKVDPEGEKTWKDMLADKGVDPKLLDLADEEGERLAAVWDIWHAVVKGFTLDEALEDSTRDIIQQSLEQGVDAAVLADNWGKTVGNVYVIKNRAKEMADKVTRAIFELMVDKDVDIGEEAARLYRAVSTMKPGRHVDKFMVALAKELLADRK